MIKYLVISIKVVKIQIACFVLQLKTDMLELEVLVCPILPLPPQPHVDDNTGIFSQLAGMLKNLVDICTALLL